MAISRTQPMRPALKDVLDEADALRNGLGTETAFREAGDAAINAKIGSGFDSTNTVAAAIAAETSARESADTTLQRNIDPTNNKIGSGFDSTNTVAAAISAEITAREGADTTLQGNIDATNNKIGSGFDSTNTVAAAIAALAARVSALEG